MQQFQRQLAKVVGWIKDHSPSPGSVCRKYYPVEHYESDIILPEGMTLSHWGATTPSWRD